MTVKELIIFAVLLLIVIAIGGIITTAFSLPYTLLLPLAFLVIVSGSFVKIFRKDRRS